MALVRVRANVAVLGLEPGDEADADNTAGTEVATLIAGGLLTSLGAAPGTTTPLQVGDYYAQEELLVPGVGGAVVPVYSPYVLAAQYAADQATQNANIIPPLKTGYWRNVPFGAPATLVLIANRTYYVPIDCTVATAIDRVGTEITGAGAAGSVLRLGLFNDSGNGIPGTVNADWGTVIGTAAGVVSIVIAKTLPLGRSWLAITGQGAPATQPTVRCTVSTNDPTTAMVAQADGYANSYIQNSVSGAYATAVIGGDNAIGPLVQVRGA